MFDSLRPLEPVALLGRSELPSDLAEPRAYLRGKRILVTGAGGSVGSALAEVLLSFEPASLWLLDNHEHSLFDLYRRFSVGVGAGALEIALADVRNAHKMQEIFASSRPEVVFHLAAYKHVPLGEKFPDEVFASNVLATSKLLELSLAYEVEAFAYPSSDKSVNPPSLYGATKRLAETLVQRTAALHRRAFAVARYVNIIGTHGSVVEIMAQQVREGAPVTVTDPAMTRYWITMAEAVWLITSVVACQPSTGIAMLDARDEVPVVDMAQRLARLLGAELDPYPVVFSGARPGERLREELLSANESFLPSKTSGILEVRNERKEQNLARVDGLLVELCSVHERSDHEQLRRWVMQAAMELQ